MLIDNYSKVLMPTHVSFEYLRDKRANLFLLVWQYWTCSVWIPDVSDICPVMIKLFSGWFIGSSDVSQEFRRSGVSAMVGISDVSRLN